LEHYQNDFVMKSLIEKQRMISVFIVAELACFLILIVHYLLSTHTQYWIESSWTETYQWIKL